MVVKIDAAGKDETVRIERSNARRNVDDRPDTGDLSSGRDASVLLGACKTE
jgi:hypothetical protein